MEEALTTANAPWASPSNDFNSKTASKCATSLSTLLNAMNSIITTQFKYHVFPTHTFLSFDIEDNKLQADTVQIAVNEHENITKRITPRKNR